MGVKMNNSELNSIAAKSRARAASARELANQLSDQEARRGVLRYADDLERDVAVLIAQSSASKSARPSMAIDVI
jgi:hypothetical protein